MLAVRIAKFGPLGEPIRLLLLTLDHARALKLIGRNRSRGHNGMADISEYLPSDLISVVRFYRGEKKEPKRYMYISRP